MVKRMEVEGNDRKGFVRWVSGGGNEAVHDPY